MSLLRISSMDIIHATRSSVRAITRIRPACPFPHLGQAARQNYGSCPLQTVIPEEDQPEMIEKIAKGNFTMRIMYEQFQNLTKMGPMSQVRTRPELPNFMAQMRVSWLTCHAAMTAPDCVRMKQITCHAPLC